MNKSDLAVFDARIKKQLGVRYTREVMTRLHALQIELLDKKKQLDEHVATGLIDGAEFASRVNNLVNRYLVDLGEVIGPKDCQAIFDVEPGEKVVIVNPEIASKVNYSE